MRFPTFPFDPSPAGKYLLALMFCQSKHYSDSLAENIKRGKRQKLLAGICPYFPPLGYLNDKITRTIVPDPARAPLIKKMFSLYSQGNITLDRLKCIMTDDGLISRKNEPLSRAQFHRLLQNPFYCGTIEFDGEVYEGKHLPLLSRKLFEACQDVRLRMRRSRTAALKPFVYRGMFRCGECGSCITCETQKGHVYLRCIKRNGPCSQSCTREERITPQIITAVKRMGIPSDWIEMLLAEFESLQQQERSIWNEQVSAAKAKVAQIDEKIQRLVNAYVDGDVPIIEYRHSKQRLLESKQKQGEMLDAMRKHPKQPFEPAKRFVRGSVEPLKISASADISQIRDFLQNNCSNLTIRDGRINACYRGAWKIVVAQGRFENRVGVAAPANACGGDKLRLVAPGRKLGDGARTLFDGVCHFFKDNPAWV